MGLTGAGTLAVALLAALAIPAAALAAWQRLGATSPSKWLARIALLGGCQLTALLLVGVSLNDAFVFYGSWAELLGRTASSGQQPAAAGSLDSSLSALLARHAAAGVGTLVSLPVPGISSGVRTGPATVYCRRSMAIRPTPGAASRWWSCSPASRAARSPGPAPCTWPTCWTS